MKKPRLVLFLTLAIALAGLSIALAQGGRRFTIALTGGAEVPGPGDPDGTGTATITLNQGRGDVCFTLEVAGLDSIIGAHIHRGGPTESGDIVVTLPLPGDTTVTDTTRGGGRDTTGRGLRCVTVSRDTVQTILRNPAGYYVNIHTTTFPDGAIRGQLATRSPGRGNSGGARRR